MSIAPKDPLLLAGKVVILLSQGFLAIGAIAVTIGLPVLLIFQDTFVSEYREETGNAEFALPVLAIFAAGVVLLAILAMAFLFLRYLHQIIDTVGEGDPFVPDNADRLTRMGWLALVIQLVVVPLAGLGLFIAKQFEDQDVTIDAGFDLGAIILIITLFILARVFRHGAAMREDLEGTV